MMRQRGEGRVGAECESGEGIRARLLSRRPQTHLVLSHIDTWSPRSLSLSLLHRLLYSLHSYIDSVEPPIDSTVENATTTRYGFALRWLQPCTQANHPHGLQVSPFIHGHHYTLPATPHPPTHDDATVAASRDRRALVVVG